MSKHIVVVGGGPAGYVAALHATSLGARVTLIETHSLGGTCLNRGCIPTKTLVAACSLLEGIRAAAGFGIDIQGGVSARWPAMLANATRVVGGMKQGVRALLSQRGVELVAGHARLQAERTVHVDGHGSVQGDFVLLCTGSRPVRPKAFPFDGRTVGTSDDLLQWDSLPASIAIVGDARVCPAAPAGYCPGARPPGAEEEHPGAGGRLQPGRDRAGPVIAQPAFPAPGI